MTKRSIARLGVAAGLLVFGVMPGMAAAQEVSEDAEVLFDDFNYTATDDEALAENGWVVRVGEGWPGVPGALWLEENVTFLADPDDENNQLVQMTSSTDGEVTTQTQICQQRKFLEGTFATRVRFSDDPVSGPDGDSIVQTFYLISPQEFDMDPLYSELDFEYLPNGGWGFNDNVFFGTTWETFQLEPWIADNRSAIEESSFDGWHTLVLQIADGEASYYIDGELLGTHDGKFYPEVPMSLNYNLWFVRDALVRSDEPRSYAEQIDWVYVANNEVVSPEDVEAEVAALREEEVTFTDTIPALDPPLETPCNF